MTISLNNILNVKTTFIVKSYDDLYYNLNKYIKGFDRISQFSIGDVFFIVDLLINDELVRLKMRKLDKEEFYFCEEKYFHNKGFIFRYNKNDLIEKSQWKNNTYNPIYNNQPITVSQRTDNIIVKFWNAKSKKLINVPLEIILNIKSKKNIDVWNIKLDEKELEALNLYLY